MPQGLTSLRGWKLSSRWFQVGWMSLLRIVIFRCKAGPSELQHTFHPRSTPALAWRASESVAPQRYPMGPWGQMITWSLQTKHRGWCIFKSRPQKGIQFLGFWITPWVQSLSQEWQVFSRVDCKLKRKSHIPITLQFFHIRPLAEQEEAPWHELSQCVWSVKGSFS